MTKKDKLIIGILQQELKGIKKLLKSHEAQIVDIQQNGFDKEIHKGNQDSIWTGLHYTQGYCTAHIFMTKKIIDLLKLEDYRDVEALIEENKLIEKENNAELKRVFDRVSQGLKKSTNHNDKKKKNKV